MDEDGIRNVKFHKEELNENLVIDIR